MYMNNDWLEFKEDGYTTKRRIPRVLLSKERHFRLNKKALELIGEPKAVRFLFDVGRSRIGIRAVEPDAAHSFPVHLLNKGHSSIVHASLFCNSMGIRPECTVEFQSVRVDDEGTLLLDLTTARRRVSSYGGGK